MSSIITLWNEWNPHDLFHCRDNDVVAWNSFFGAIGVVFWYMAIIWKIWLPSAKSSSPGASRAMYTMALIFLICGVAGYGTIALAAFSPKWAYLAQIGFLNLQNIAAPVFLFSARGKSFRLMGDEQAAGAELLAHPELAEGSEGDLLKLARSILIRDRDKRSQAAV